MPDLPLLKIFEKRKNLDRSSLEQLNKESLDLLNNLSNTVEENIKISKINDDVPLFVKNYYTDKQQEIPKEFLNKKEDVSDDLKKQSASNQPKIIKENEEEKNKKPLILLQKKNVRELANNIKTVVFGQDDVIDEMVDVLKVATLNIKINKEKPAGCYFLAGPSGCGKTEIAMSLAKFLGDADNPIPMLKLNMGEYGMENDVTKLIGAPPGYKGSDDGGALTNFVMQNPISIVLFDEVEKAHDSMDKVMLSIMDNGTCTDSKGNVVSFKNTIVLATSNLGAEVEYEQGFTKEQKNNYRMEAIKSNIKPEIINRYDSIFHCNAIDKQIYKKILLKFLNILNSSMKGEHDIELKFTDKLVDWSVENSYDPAMGGRPARKFIEKIIIKPIADQMIDDKFTGEGVITIDLNKDENVVFKNKKRQTLGILEDTKKLVERLGDNSFSNKKPTL